MRGTFPMKSITLLTIIGRYSVNGFHSIEKTAGTTATTRIQAVTRGGALVNSIPPYNDRQQKHSISTIASSAAVSSSTTSTSLELFSPISTALVSMYTESPFTANILTGGTLALCGDAIAQFFSKSSKKKRKERQSDEQKEFSYDMKRASAFVLFDCCYRASQTALFPVITNECDGRLLSSIWPTFLGHSKGIESSLSVVEQTFANQFLVIPLLYYPLFFTLTGYLQGLNLKQIWYRAKTTIFPLLKRNWLFWIPMQFIQVKQPSG